MDIEKTGVMIVGYIVNKSIYEGKSTYRSLDIMAKDIHGLLTLNVDEAVYNSVKSGDLFKGSLSITYFKDIARFAHKS